MIDPCNVDSLSNNFSRDNILSRDNNFCRDDNYPGNNNLCEERKPCEVDVSGSRARPTQQITSVESCERNLTADFRGAASSPPFMHSAAHSHQNQSAPLSPPCDGTVAQALADSEPWEVERYELWDAGWQALMLSDLDRRAFLGISGGLLVLFWTHQVPAQPPARGRLGSSAASRQISAWIHIDEHGQITAYSGKVEVGQNVRTLLAQVVADELAVTPDLIRIVLGDTEQTPFDAGTFGSRSVPAMVPQMRRAAAAMRDALIEMAAARWQTDPKHLQLEAGKVVDSLQNRKLTFAALTGGQRLKGPIADDVTPRPDSQWTHQGTSVRKINGTDIVTGRHKFSSDVQLSEMLHGKVLRPPTLTATLRSVDTHRAQAMNGVVVVHDGAFVGVAAPTLWQAEQALAAIDAQWEPGAELSSDGLYEHLKRTASSTAGRGGFGRGSTSEGNVDQALREADITLQQSYQIAYIAHVPLEPRAAVAQWQGESLTVWTGTQRPFGVRDELARALGIPPDKVRVIVPDTGSGFGGKHTGEAAIEAARLARAAGRPVKLVWTRQEEFQWAYFRPAGVIDIRSGVQRDGSLVAWQCDNYNCGESALATPYNVPHRRVQFYRCQAPLRQGSYRALAATANVFARETCMDELAHALKLDPLEFRLKNLRDERLRAVLRAAAENFGWGKSAPDSHGFGIACGTEKGSYVATCAEVEVDLEDERVRVVRVVTAFECGAILNPDQLKNQVEGALVMGLGGALFEEVQFRGSQITNAKLSAYRVPRFRDVPQIDVVLLDRRDVPSAGAGETPLIAIAPAMGNAIFAASGVRLRRMPLLGNGMKNQR